MDVYVTSGGYAGTVDFFTRPEKMEEFGKKLQAFTKDINDIAMLEIGSLYPMHYNYRSSTNEARQGLHENRLCSVICRCGRHQVVWPSFSL